MHTGPRNYNLQDSIFILALVKMTDTFWKADTMSNDYLVRGN